MTLKEHHERAAAVAPAAVAIVTVSDTRTPGTDASGAAIRACCESAGFGIASHDIVPDEPKKIAGLLRRLVARAGTDAVILTGGTGISPRDKTAEAVQEVIERRLDGFGELFRMLSFQEIGPAAMLSRAVAGIADGRPVFALPGSEAAVRLAMERLILPELRHILAELKR